MTECSGRQLVFKGCFGRKVVADFRGGEITSDAGGVLLREADRQAGSDGGIGRVHRRPPPAGQGDSQRAPGCFASLRS